MAKEYNFTRLVKERPKSILIVLVLTFTATLITIGFTQISFDASLLGVLKIVMLFLIVYVLKIIISYLNRLEFIRIAYKYNITCLKTKQEFLDYHKESKLLDGYFFVDGIQFNGLTDFTVTTKEDINNLPKEQVRELYGAGLKLKAALSLIGLIILIVLNNNDSSSIIFFTLAFVWGNTLRSLFRDESDVRHLINSFGE